MRKNENEHLPSENFSMIDHDLVSVICLCYNHQPYVAEAIQSVFDQDYEKIELIVVDDASTDGSQEEIQKKLAGTNVKFISHSENTGHCRAFNIGLAHSRGNFIIDLAADDLLLPDRISTGIRDFRSSKDTGVHFSDAFLCDVRGKRLGTHYERDQKDTLITKVPSGDIYCELISRYFICPPTMMIKREVLDELGGYDESLAYEDFDFWIRSARKFHYVLNKRPLIVRRILKGSDSKKQFSFRSKHSRATFLVCEKIYALNTEIQEDLALLTRARYEIKQCLKTLNLELIPGYLRLIRKVKRRAKSS